MMVEQVRADTGAGRRQKVINFSGNCKEEARGRGDLKQVVGFDPPHRLKDVLAAAGMFGLEGGEPLLDGLAAGGPVAGALLHEERDGVIGGIGLDQLLFGELAGGGQVTVVVEGEAFALRASPPGPPPPGEAPDPKALGSAGT